MSQSKTKQVKSPTGLSRLLWRAPIWFYRFNLGWLLTGRMMLINHIGRKSGKPRQNVVEVARYDKATHTRYVCSGFGKNSQWYRNLEAHPDITIQTAGKKLAVHAKLLSPDESADEMQRYVEHNPKLIKGLLNVVGYDVPDSMEGYRQLAHDKMPFVAFIPR